MDRGRDRRSRSKRGREMDSSNDREKKRWMRKEKKEVKGKREEGQVKEDTEKDYKRIVGGM